MKPLAVCAIFKNEAPFLLEWIAYHRVIGFDSFILYDNESTDGGADLVRSCWAADLATVVPWPRRPGQLAAYRHFTYNFAAGFEWAAFIDLDEFLLPLRGAGIRGSLRSWGGFSAILVHWRSFGPSGWMQPPAGLVIENYDLRSPDEMPVNKHVKSIVKCSDLLDVSGNPHEFQVRGPVCNTQGRVVGNVAIQPAACHENLVLNHYVTRSRQDWMAKIGRGSAMFQYKEPKYRAELFEHFAEVSRVKDTSIKRFAPLVRTLLAGGAGAAGTSGGAASFLTDATSPDSCALIAHIQNVGDVDGRIGDWVGMRGSGRWIEGFSITPRQGLSAGDIECQVIPGGGTVVPWLPGGTFCGSRGLGLPIRGFQVRLRGGAAGSHDCAYAATFTDGSEAGPVPSGQPCVAATMAPLEALRVIIRPRASPACGGSTGLPAS